MPQSHIVCGFRLRTRILNIPSERRLIYEFRFRAIKLLTPKRHKVFRHVTKYMLKFQILCRARILTRILNIASERRLIIDFRFRANEVLTGKRRILFPHAAEHML